ncbi:MAG: hypothetical protein EOP84_11740 [Verrucomicrobiaceae bacterium]|nr:MAG: hypothetical protein EOP84_11740 [Verrucomicrobiaceae bacterium]
MSLSEQSEEDREYMRRKALRALRVYFAQRRWPRIAMSLILLCTGGVGFGTSFLFLQAGVNQMWLRYPLALLVGWAVFLALVRIWAELERRSFRADEDIAALLKGRDPKETKERLEDRDWSVFDGLDLSGLDGGEEGCVVGVALMIVGALLLAAGWAIFGVLMAAPVLIAEVFLDAVLVAALYNRMRGLDQRWWLAGAVRQTIGPVLATAAFLMVAGFLMQVTAPEAKSIGGVIRHFREGK